MPSDAQFERSPTQEVLPSRTKFESLHNSHDQHNFSQRDYSRCRKVPRRFLKSKDLFNKTRERLIEFTIKTLQLSVKQNTARLRAQAKESASSSKRSSCLEAYTHPGSLSFSVSWFSSRFSISLSRPPWANQTCPRRRATARLH